MHIFVVFVTLVTGKAFFLTAKYIFIPLKVW